MDDRRWELLAQQQHGMLAVRQLTRLGVPRGVVRHRLATEMWVQRTEHVVSTTTGELIGSQRMWLGVLHAGNGALIGGLTAAGVHGLRNWARDEATVLVDDEWSFEPVPGIQFVRTRRCLPDFAAARHPLRRTLPVCQLEPAALLFAGYERHRRTAHGVLAAVVQQQLTSAEALRHWLERMRPLRRAREFRRVLLDIETGAQSAAELDVSRMCRTFGLPMPGRQRPRRDRAGKSRFTDCEWRLADGRLLILEIDGGFHLAIQHYDEDMKRQRKLITRQATVLRCGAAELREDPGSVAQDLFAMGVAQSWA